MMYGAGPIVQPAHPTTPGTCRQGDLLAFQPGVVVVAGMARSLVAAPLRAKQESRAVAHGQLAVAGSTRTQIPSPKRAACVTDPLVFPRTGVVARNRTMLAAMTNRQSLPDGTLSKEEVDWLLMRASRGFGIVTTACAHVSQDGQGFDGELGVWNDAHLAGLAYLADGLRARGALGIVQVFHAGMKAPDHLTGVQPLSPSVNPTDSAAHGCNREMSENDIRRVINDFAVAAGRVASAGFDGVELHAAHGYLINQFLSSETNRRRDAWGGSAQNRSRFLFEILGAVRRRVPDKFLIGVRISPEYPGITLEESLALVARLSQAGVDFIHLSCWDSFNRSRGHPHDSRTLTEWFTSSLAGLPPVMSAGEIWTPSDAQRVLRMGADFVAVARSAIGNPDWASQIGNPAYEPMHPPYTAEHLERCGLNRTFVHYMRNWNGFVAP